MTADNDRTLILDRIRLALRDIPDGEQAEDVPVPRRYQRSHATGDLVALFAERASDYRAAVTRTDERHLPAVIARLLSQRGIDVLLAPPRFPASWLAEWLAMSDTGTVAGDEPPLSVAHLDAMSGVVTTAALAVAETGTIVLDGGPGQGRRALTLLPDYHLCIVRAEQIAADVPDAIHRLDPTRPITMISGPSATSDIENTRVEGVHGPRTLEIVIVEQRRPPGHAQ